ncbi:sulfotransferase [Acaryochloris sp. IP29b_bin.148]|uniref:sulfotransferase family protein n=1 Tax=Acaryochloris sp. IP29b_bin.148 TaxID=2969218 RepID=UPI002615ADBD|nr:sulfotransferase [Acaryochloris sp. IP29b_bin.148]
MSLPNFLIIGAQKSGTSWLARILGDHPEIFMANSEIYFFNNKDNFHKGMEWYESYFASVNNETLIGEKTPGYLSHPDACLRIYHNLPDVKLIVVLRNPIKRAVSAINHHKRKGRISPLLNSNTLLLGILSGDEKYNSEELKYQFISRGQYYSQIKRYYDYFSSKSILVLSYEEDIVKHPTESLQKVCEFLGADPRFKFNKIERKVNSYNIKTGELLLNYYIPFLKPINHYVGKIFPDFYSDDLEESTICELQEFYSEDNEKLFDLLGRTINSLNTSR